MPKHMPRSLVSQPGGLLCKLTASRVNLQGDLQQVLSMVFIAYSMAENIDTMRGDSCSHGIYWTPLSCQFLIEGGAIAGFNRAIFLYNMA
jgi:hypothetical protein